MSAKRRLSHIYVGTKNDVTLFVLLRGRSNKDIIVIILKIIVFYLSIKHRITKLPLNIRELGSQRQLGSRLDRKFELLRQQNLNFEIYLRACEIDFTFDCLTFVTTVLDVVNLAKSLITEH